MFSAEQVFGHILKITIWTEVHFRKEFKDGRRKIKKEILEDVDIEIESLHNCIDIKEEPVDESQFDEDYETQLRKFESENADITRKTGTNQSIESDNLVNNGFGKQSPLKCGCNSEPHNSMDDLSSTSNDLTTSIPDTPSSSVKYRRKKRLGTKKESFDISTTKQKLLLQIEYLKLQTNLTKIGILKLERELTES